MPVGTMKTEYTEESKNT